VRCWELRRVVGEVKDALQFFDYWMNSFEMNSLTTALRGKKLRTSRENVRTWKQKGRTSREERPHFRGKSSALRGKKDRTSREKAPHFEGKKDGVNPVNTNVFQYPHDIN
jgi:hypothetical protein